MLNDHHKTRANTGFFGLVYNRMGVADIGRQCLALVGNGRYLTARFTNPTMWRVGQPIYCCPEALFHHHRTAAHLL